MKLNASEKYLFKRKLDDLNPVHVSLIQLTKGLSCKCCVGRYW